MTASRLLLCLVGLLALGTSLLHGADPLPGTKPLTLSEPLDIHMVDGIDRFLLREIQQAAATRGRLWQRDVSSPQAYLASVASQRERWRTVIGAVDPRSKETSLDLMATATHSAQVCKTDRFSILAVRWSVLDGVTAEGLLLQPTRPAIARIIALPDADTTPEVLAGLAPGSAQELPVARRLAELGCQVIVPTLINRDDTHSGNPDIRFTNQPHREWVYRQAFELGRHIVGYEVQKVLAAVDRFQHLNTFEKRELPVGVIGCGEGGLIALAAAALDPRISATVVSGYFGPRENVWQEPIYRNIWSQLREFGDAELASLVAPRALVIEVAKTAEVAGPPAPRAGRAGAAPGRIVAVSREETRREFDRAAAIYQQLKVADRCELLLSGAAGQGPAGSPPVLEALLKHLGSQSPAGASNTSSPGPSTRTVPLQDERVGFSAEDRQQRQVRELVDFTQKLLRRSASERDKLWAKADRSSVANWEKTAGTYRELVYQEMIGKLPDPTLPLNPRTREVLDDPAFRAYEVVLDVYPDVVAGGILLLPKNLQPGEKRPVVVCQHGLEGTPMDTITQEGQAYQYYKGFAAELARRGFITYAPQNPYRGKDRFRTLQRKANPLKLSLFSFIIRQHERTLQFLKTHPNVDGSRIGFYGLSYGGKTAVRVPPLLQDYCLSICSADYNEWVVKNATVSDRYSYMFTGEYEIFEWNMGHVANYAELSYLMTPRPFMVERGHHDGVAPDEWVAWEFAKVRRHYDILNLGPKTEIEFFNGPHTINGVATYDFLHRHLNWPRPASR